MKKIYFVRHGEAEHNLMKYFSGDDSPLTEFGREQALRAAEEIKGLEEKIQAIVASPLTRTRQTAHIIADELGFPKEKIDWDRRIEELQFGNLIGMLNSPLTRKLRDKYFLDSNNPKGVEPITDLIARLRPAADDLLARAEDTILVVGHGMSGRMLRRLLGDRDHTEPMQRLDNAQIIQLYPYVEADSKAEKVL